MKRFAHTLLLAAMMSAAGAITAPARAYGQTAVLTIRATVSGNPVESAQVSAGTIGALTSVGGEAQLRLAGGHHTVRIVKIGFRSVELQVRLTAGRDTMIAVAMIEEVIETDAIVVTSARIERRIEDEPIRIEVIGREEVEEKLLMTPGDISMLLNETSGLRVQPTAPALGGASVRIQGLRGRYAQILSDGLPLYGGQTGALGPLQIPPMDLGQVEVIKGVASALYGATALGGVINLLSRRPAEAPEQEVLLNQTTLGGTDAVLWASGPLNQNWGYTFLGSAHRQAAADVDDDAWADLPQFRRGAIRPRLFWKNTAGTSFLVTAGGMIEDREGGTIDDAANFTFRESVETRRGDAGFVGRMLLGNVLLSVRGSAVVQRHEHGFGVVTERDQHTTAFTEAALSGASDKHLWVVGLAVQREAYDAEEISGFDYVHLVPGLFVQDEYTPVGWLTLSGSARIDNHNEYGTFVNPRLSALLKPGSWTVRVSAGTGYFAPTPWVEEIESVGLSRLAPLNRLQAERARSASVDVGRSFGALELNATAFASHISDPVQARVDPSDDSRYLLFNAAAPVRTHGTELLARYERAGLHATATYVFMRSTELDPETGFRRDVPLTPNHTAGLVAAWEQEGHGRIGLEFYFTGRQEVDENPYRTSSRPYTIVGFLVERRIGRARVFLNAENLFDTRQTRHDPLLLPTQSAQGRWITDVWAPLEGRSFNAGVRLQLGSASPH
ncbi:MAG TPA: TonB-dependent receptor [Longimicrobiales bacterium]